MSTTPATPPTAPPRAPARPSRSTREEPTAGTAGAAPLGSAGAARREAAAWAVWQVPPGHRLRHRVVARSLAEAAADLSPAPLRVLDAGGGDGRDAVLLALAGHEVTVLDTSAESLHLAREAADAAGVGPLVRTLDADLEDLTALTALTAHRSGGHGSYDLVLCHDVLQHRGSTAQVVADVATLASSLRPGGVLSLLAANPAARLVDLARRGELAEAFVLLHDADTDADTGTGAADGLGVGGDGGSGGRARTAAPGTELALDADLIAAAVGLAGCSVDRRLGVLAVADLLGEDVLHDPERLADLEELELALRDRDPHRATARSWHLLARRAPL